MRSDIETHVIGEFSGGNGDTTTVTILRPGKHVLVLSGHEANTWTVELGPDVELEHVYAVGYHPQTVKGVPAGVDIVTDSMDEDGVWANGYQYPNHDTQSLLTLASERIHHVPTSFHGCHTVSSWTLNEDMSGAVRTTASWLRSRPMRSPTAAAAVVKHVDTPVRDRRRRSD